MTHVRRYFEEMGVNKELEFIDEHKFVELVYADLPPLPTRVKINPIMAALSNLTLAAATGMFVAWLAGMIAPTWFALVCGGSCSIVYCLLWFGSTGDSGNFDFSPKDE